MNRSGRSVAQQAGFTLIELIMVVVILGVLSAFALPRFANFRGGAQENASESLVGALNAAASVAHSQQLASGITANNPVILDGGVSVNMVNGYPAATALGIGAALQSLSGFRVAYAGSTATYTSDSNNVCVVTYAAATVAGNVTTPPAINHVDCTGS